MCLAKPSPTPMVSSTKLAQDAGSLLVNPYIYRSIVGALLYVCHTRPDIGVGNVVPFEDADWGNSLDDRRSTTGYCVYIDNCLVTWSFKKQKSMSRSTSETEYRSVADAVSEVMWVNTVLSDMGVNVSTPPVVWCDNTSAVAMSANSVFHSRPKHVEVHMHFVRGKSGLTQSSS
ncbi:hypothetical protein GQ457_07G006640 [Hibiscus cannabinus]